MIRCIKNYVNGVTYFTKGNIYDIGISRPKNYTVSAPGNHKQYIKVASDISDVCWSFPMVKFKEYFSEELTETEKSTESPILITKPKEIKMGLKNKKETFNVRDTFLALTSHTYPHGNEHRLRYFLPDGVTRDRHGNYIYQIGNSRTIFACHLDTANSTFGPVVHVIDGDIIKTDGKTILGADDKAGVTVLLYLIHNRIPGTYYFFVGEECGCIGSKAASKDGNFENYDRIISFDRRNVCSIITYQQGSRCCSNDFANSLAEQYNNLGMNLKPDDTGLVTDSAQFTNLIAECTNISVGYYSEHTHNERQDIGYLTRLCEASIKVNWEALPSVRDPKVVERKYSNNNNHSNFPPKNRESYSHHGRSGKFKNHHSYNQYDLFAQAERHSYNQHDNFFDRAMEDDFRDKKKKKKDKKKGKKYDRFDRFDEFQDVNEDMIEALIRDKSERDIYLPFRELLNECAFIGEPNLLSQDEYAIVEENMVRGW